MIITVASPLDPAEDRRRFFLALFSFRLTGKEKSVGGFDLMWDDGPVYADGTFLEPSAQSNPPLNSFLGR